MNITIINIIVGSLCILTCLIDGCVIKETHRMDKKLYILNAVFGVLNILIALLLTTNP